MPGRSWANKKRKTQAVQSLKEGYNITSDLPPSLNEVQTFFFYFAFLPY